VTVPEGEGSKSIAMMETLCKAMLEKGFTPEYGAREMDRVVAQYLKPLLMKAILFGKLKKGGEALVDAQNDALMIAAN
jgi:ATP-dependent Clp protease ATP-binding subunit ClpA